LIAGVTGPGDLKALGEREGFDSGLEEGYRRESTLGKAGASEILDDAIYNLKEGEISKNPIKWGAGYLVIAANKRTDPDMTRLPGEREGIRQKLLQERQNGYYDAYLKATRKQYEDQGLIKIYQDRIDSALNSGQ